MALDRRKVLLIAIPLLVVAALAAGIVVAVSGGSDDEPPPSTTTTTKPDPTVPEGAVTAPLTGLALEDPVVALRPPLAVKIDNVDGPQNQARPQAGIASADIVIEEIVEGGITRLVAVLQSELPDRVGPVRSARTTDPALLGQLGRPLFAWSGGNPGVVSAVHSSALIDVGFDAVPPAYSRDGGRRAPHNLFGDVDALYAAAPKDAPHANPLFTYRDAEDELPDTAREVRGVRLDFGGFASVQVTYEYDAKNDGWQRGQNGTLHKDEDGRQIAPTNVVILFTTYQPSPADPRSPEAQTVGTGEAWVFTKGSVIQGSWRRDAVEQPFRITDAAGRGVDLTPGRTWIELPTQGAATIEE